MRMEAEEFWGCPDCTTDQLNTIGFITGIDANGALTTANGWTWNGDNPATYGASGSAHKWGGGAAGDAGRHRHFYYFDPGSNWSAAEQGGLHLRIWRCGRRRRTSRSP